MQHVVFALSRRSCHHPVLPPPHQHHHRLPSLITAVEIDGSSPPPQRTGMQHIVRACICNAYEPVGYLPNLLSRYQVLSYYFLVYESCIPKVLLRASLSSGHKGEREGHAMPRHATPRHGSAKLPEMLPRLGESHDSCSNPFLCLLQHTTLYLSSLADADDRSFTRVMPRPPHYDCTLMPYVLLFRYQACAVWYVL